MDRTQNLIDSLSCAVACPPHNRLSEVAICFGGKLLRGNRAQKVVVQTLCMMLPNASPQQITATALRCNFHASCVQWVLLGVLQVHSSSYQAFASPSYPEIAILGVDIEWRCVAVLLFCIAAMNICQYPGCPTNFIADLIRNLPAGQTIFCR